MKAPNDRVRHHIERRPLTARQRQVLVLIERGYSNAEIALALEISLDGAKWHVAEILGRLGFDSRKEAARWARMEAA